MTATPQRAASPALSAARAAIAARDFQRADDLYRQLWARNRSDPELAAEYGLFCLRTGRADGADYLLSRAIVAKPGEAAWWAHQGYARLETEAASDARASFERSLALTPDDPAANYGLALCLQREGSWAQAARALAKALAAAGEGGDGLPIALALIDAHRKAGQLAEARAGCEQIERTAPNEPALWYAWAKVLRDAGDPARALSYLDRCLQHTSGEPRIVLEKARCLRALGDPAQALQWLARLEAIAPGTPELHEECGWCLAAPGERGARARHWIAAIDLWGSRAEYEPAEKLLARLLADDPASADGWNSRGMLENARHRTAAAEAAWREAIARDPAQLRAAANLALFYESANRLDDAERIARTATASLRDGRKHDGAIEAHLALCKLARRRRDVAGGLEQIARIEALAPNQAQRMHAAFEQGKLLDMHHDVAGAMAAFALANQLALAPWQHDNPGRNKALAGVEYMLSLARKDWLRDWQPVAGLPAHRDIAFLIGFPRSGTTLLNQVLDGHPSICALEEKPVVQRIMDRVHAMPAGYPHALPQIDAPDVGWLRAAYFREAARHGADAAAPLLLDKFPMHTTLAPLLHRVFPQARFVFALRHPCDVVLSCFMQSFRLNNTMANFCTLADTVALYVRTMELWQHYREQLPLRVHAIRYEDVVDDFDGQVAALCRFLGVSWQDDLRDFSTRALARGRIDTPSYEQVSRPIYREARYRWQRYRAYLEPFLPALQPWIERFGYETTTRTATDDAAG